MVCKKSDGNVLEVKRKVVVEENRLWGERMDSLV